MKTKEELVKLRENLHIYVDQLNTKELKIILFLLNAQKKDNLLSKDMLESTLNNLLDSFPESNSTDNSKLFINCLFQIITSIEKNALETLLTQLINAEGEEEALYNRTLVDFIELQKYISSIREAVIDKVEFTETLKKMNHDISSAKKHLKLVCLLADSLEKIIDLMNYDDPKRYSLDIIKDGFQFTSGSMSFSHKYHYLPETVDK